MFVPVQQDLWSRCTLTPLGSHLLNEMKYYEVDILEKPEVAGKALQEELDGAVMNPALLVTNSVTLGRSLNSLNFS